MKSELQQKIFDKYPKMFGDRTKPTASCEGKVVEVDGVKYKLVKA